MPQRDISGPAPVKLQAAIYAIAFFTGNLFPMMSVVMPLWALELGATPLVIGLIISSRQILVVLFSIHGGALLDRYGPRHVIMVFGLVGCVLMVSYPLLPFIGAAIILQMVSGFAETTNWIGTQALVGRLLKGHAVYAGRMTAAARLGGFIGPLMTGIVWQWVGPAGAFVFVAIWVLCGVGMAYLLPDSRPERKPEEGPDEAPEKSVLPKLSDYKTTFKLLLLPAVALVIAATFMRQTGSGIQSSFYGVWLTQIGYSASMIGFLIGLGNAVSAGSALTIGPLTRRWADHWLLIVTVLLSIVAIAVTPWSDAILFLVVAISFRGLGQGLNLPLMMAIAAGAVGFGLQGRVAALRISFNRLGGMLVPIAMGGIAEIVGLEYAFYIMGGFGVVLIALLSLWLHRHEAF